MKELKKRVRVRVCVWVGGNEGRREIGIDSIRAVSHELFTPVSEFTRFEA